jgi:hypothetical protein
MISRLIKINLLINKKYIYTFMDYVGYLFFMGVVGDLERDD